MKLINWCMSMIYSTKEEETVDVVIMHIQLSDDGCVRLRGTRTFFRSQCDDAFDEATCWRR